jgi:Domain of unknown function (DUF4129)
LTADHVIALAWFYLAIGGSGAAVVLEAPARWIAEPSIFSQEVHASRTGEGPARQALRAGSYPWYDPADDTVKPTSPPWLSGFRERLQKIAEALGRFLARFRFGSVAVSGIDSLGTLLLLAALVAFFVVLIILWFRLDGIATADRIGAMGRLGTAARLAQLPEGIRPGGNDPWAEALARQAAGDLAGAVISLFAHQLLSLDQLGLIRLAPGRTARQYIRALGDPDFRDYVSATLGLFEDVYYGRKRPTRAAFESVWRSAQAFEERRRLLGASG